MVETAQKADLHVDGKKSGYTMLRKKENGESILIVG